MSVIVESPPIYQVIVTGINTYRVVVAQTILQGPAGPIGPQGPQGPPGDAGEGEVTLEYVDGALATKVDKIEGKGLSTEDYTSVEKTKLAGVASDATANSADATLLNRANHTGTQPAASIVDFDNEVSNNASVVAATNHAANTSNPHNVTKSQIGLGNVDNTADADKPISVLTQAALDEKATQDDIDTSIAALVDSSPSTLNTLNELAAALGDDPNFATTIAAQIGDKVDKVAGKGLSTEDYTSAEKTKLSGIATGATANSSDATLLARANHTGIQAASTISDFDTEVSNNTDVAAATAHIASTSNPHSVTKAQVGLGNVDNTSDLNKPISTAIQAALDDIFSTAIFSGHIGMAMPRSFNTTLDAFGLSVINTGTATARDNRVTTNIFTLTPRIGYVSTTATTNSVAGVRNNITQTFLGDGSGKGGFYWSLTGGISSASTIAGLRGFAGFLGNANSFTSSSDPSSLTNIFGFAFDAGETQWSFIHNDGSDTAAKIALNGGTGLPTNTISTDLYEFRIWSVANSQVVNYRIRNLSTGVIASGSVSTDLPTGTTGMGWQFGLSSGATASTPAVDIASIFYRQR